MFYKFLTLTPKWLEPERLCLTVSWHPNRRAQTAAPKRTILKLHNQLLTVDQHFRSRDGIYTGNKSNGGHANC